MKRLLAVVLVTGFSTGFSTVALAQGAPAKEEDKTVYKKKTTYDFTDETIEGSTPKPDMTIFIVPPKAKFKSMIRIRANFHDELVKSAAAL